MNQHAILLAIGSDRPGLVDEVARFVFERGGNIEDSRMVNLRGQFAMIVLIGGDSRAIGRIDAELSGLRQNTGLHAELREALPSAPAAAGPAIPYRLTATALDQPGLVHRLAHVLRSAGANIESMDTRLIAAPMSGTPLFEMDVLMSLPASTPIAQVRSDLARLCNELNVDFQLAAATP